MTSEESVEPVEASFEGLDDESLGAAEAEGEALALAEAVAAALISVAFPPYLILISNSIC